MRTKLTWLLPVLLTGCVTAVPTPSGRPPARPSADRAPPPARPAPLPVPQFRAPQVLREPGLEGVIEQQAAALIRKFGSPRLDVREGDMRKLQFAGQACVLDVFLYPKAQGAEPVATYVEARRPSDGQEVGRAACVQALQQR